jgi:hypothetical protein
VRSEVATTRDWSSLITHIMVAVLLRSWAPGMNTAATAAMG